MKRSLLVFAALASALTPAAAQPVCEAGAVDLRIERRDDSVFASGFSAFALEGHFVWCGSAIRAEEDGRYYLFYSAMESGGEHPPFVDAWVLGSKIGVAVSDTPAGGFEDLGFFFNADGYSPDGGSWDAQSVSNTHIRRFGGRYYLYYCGGADPGEEAPVRGRLSRRDRIQQSLKIGVLSFDSMADLLAGRFERSEAPLLAPRTRVKSDNVLDPSPEGTVAGPDNLIVVNPSVVRNPSDGKYYLYFKGNVYDPHWRGVHGVAVSDSPAGPFEVRDEPVFEFDAGEGRKLSAEDPFVWYHPGDRCFYAVFKDFTGDFTGEEPGLAIMTSTDGLRWTLPDRPLFMRREILLRSGERVAVDRLERPQLLLDANGDPQVLFAACSVVDPNPRRDGCTFNVQIPIVRCE